MLIAVDPQVVVIDDHELFRGGLVDLLRERRIRVIGEAGSGAEGVAMVQRLLPDVVLMDMSMPGMSGVEATQRITAAAPRVKVLVLTVVADEAHVMDALLAGACGYLLKDASIEKIVDGIRAAAAGESLISPQIAAHLVRRVREPASAAPPLAGGVLTPRELEVLGLVARGMDNPGIAGTLHLSQHTIKNHVSSILIKLEVENRIQAAVRAVRSRLV